MPRGWFWAIEPPRAVRQSPPPVSAENRVAIKSIPAVGYRIFNDQKPPLKKNPRPTPDSIDSDVQAKRPKVPDDCRY